MSVFDLGKTIWESESLRSVSQKLLQCQYQRFQLHAPLDGENLREQGLLLERSLSTTVPDLHRRRGKPVRRTGDAHSLQAQLQKAHHDWRSLPTFG